MTRQWATLVFAVLAACGAAYWLATRAWIVESAVVAEVQTPSDTNRPTSAALVAPIAPFTTPEPARPELAVSQLDEHAAPPKQPSPTVLYGFLLPAKGRTALVDAGVSLVDRLGDSQHTRCGADGAYSFSGVAPGHYFLLSRSPRDGSVRVEVDVDGSALEKRVDLQLVPSPEVLVKTTDSDGKPFEAHTASLFVRLMAVATQKPPDEWLDDLGSPASGPYGVGLFLPSWEANLAEPDEVLGTLVLQHEPPVYVSVVAYQHVLATKRIEPGQSEVVFVLDRNSAALQAGSLRFRFVDADTHAAIDVSHVMLHGHAMRNVTKDGDAYLAPKLPPGLYRIDAFARGHERLGRRARVVPGVETDLGDIALEQEQWISGTVVDAEGHGCEMEVTWEDYDREKGATPRPDSMYVARSKSDGSFRIAGLSRRLYLVQTMSRDDAPFADWSKVIDTSRGPVDNVRIGLVRGVPLVVRASDPENWRSVRFRILDGSGSEPRTRQLWSFDPQKILLAPGSYTIEVRADEHAAPNRTPITIASKPVDLAIP